MATNSEGRQATCRTAASTTGTYNEDWLAYCDGSGTFNEQMSKGPNSTATQDEWGAFTAS